ncbi:hypothetical protein GGU10DRAFT_365662 [Lentinula aff. detonsa]|uniref:Uncharacterized protein n=1 Tax=Lentinula aff. detonsa TaxID=2804958 RepID=A0AA38KU91_9AGAR|nr:hypothetical protein GGU10DRAFT_365662 [Lentinula aff. detonsa]
MREEQLKSTFFNHIVAQGARFMRHDRSTQNALEIITHILTLTPTDVQIQEEIRIGGKGLEDTAAGSIHREEVERVLAKHKQEIASLGKEIDTIKHDNESLRRDLLKKGLEDSLKSRGQLEDQYKSVDVVRSATLELLQVQLEDKKATTVVAQVREEIAVQRTYEGNGNGEPLYFPHEPVLTFLQTSFSLPIPTDILHA